MTELILHHYPQSPFSEKTRAMLNARGLAWRSVIIPMIMPRPETIPLTGGYRRTPVLQVGADIYCDTALIAAYIDRIGQGPTFYPNSHRLATQTLARWIDSELFWAAVPLRFQSANMGSFFSSPEAATAFMQDRANFSEGATARRLSLAEAQARYQVFLAELEAQLSDGRTYLFGPDWSIADFSAYHMMWFIHAGGAMAEALADRAATRAWFERMAALGQTQGETMSGAEALDVALRSTPAPIEMASDIDEIAVGALVDVGPTDYGVMPSRGELLRCDTASLVIRRDHALTGKVHVHFPRHGFGVTPAT